MIIANFTRPFGKLLKSILFFLILFDVFLDFSVKRYLATGIFGNHLKVIQYCVKIIINVNL